MSFPHTTVHRGIYPQNQQNAAFVKGTVDPSVKSRMKVTTKEAPYTEHKDKTDRVEAHEAVYGFVGKNRCNFQHADAMPVLSRFNGIIPKQGSKETKTYAQCLKSIEALEDEIEFRGVSVLPMGKDPLFSHASDASVAVQGTATTFYTRGHAIMPGTLVQFQLPRPVDPGDGYGHEKVKWEQLRRIEKMDEGVIRPDLVPVENFDISAYLKKGGRFWHLLETYRMEPEEYNVPFSLQALVNSVDWGLTNDDGELEQQESSLESVRSYTDRLRVGLLESSNDGTSPWSKKMNAIYGFLKYADTETSIAPMLLRSWVKTLNAAKNTFWLQERRIVGRVTGCHPKRFSSLSVVY